MLKLRLPLQKFHKFAAFVAKVGRFSDKEFPPYPILFIFFFQGCWNTIQKNADFRKAFTEEISILCDKHKRSVKEADKKIKEAEDSESLN